MNFVNEGGLRAQSWNNHAHVAEELGKAIVAGEFPPGTMIPLDPDLCEMFGVSRTVVREAKKTLAAKGFVQSKAKVGTHVRPKTAWNMFDIDVLRWHAAQKDNKNFLRELCEIRLIFEPAAAAQVATKASDTQIEQLLSLANSLSLLTANATDFALADLKFHKSILQMTDNAFLSSMGDLVQTSLHGVFSARAELLDGDVLNQMCGENVEIAHAIRDHHPERAKDLMTKVITHSRDALVDHSV